MNSGAPQSNDPGKIQPREKKESPRFALILAFIPAAMVLALLTFKPNIRQGGLTGACILSATCCFISSFMLFSRRTGPAILAGIIFLILNGLIAFFFGCAASFQL